jgi:ADP-ribosylglycohydrolase/transcriptional regulator with XRE-family HTH domain
MANRKEELDAKRLSDPRVDSINEELQLRGMSKQDLLKAIGSKDYSTLCKVLNGINPLSDKMLRRIAEGLGLPTQYFVEREIINTTKPQTRKGYQLMSEILKEVPEFVRWCESQDVTKLHDFFFNEPTRPLIATGHGGKYAEAVYAALLYGTYQGLGRAVTCYSCNSLSDATIKNSKVLLVSKGMANIDINYIAKRCMGINPTNTCAVRVKGEKEDADICKLLDKKCGCSLQYDIGISDGFISIKSVFFYTAIFYKAFTNDSDFARKLDFNPIASKNYTYESASGIASVPSLDKIKHFTVLYGSYAEPIAYNIESNIVEAGIASCMIADYKNYTHGRFLTEGNYIKNDVFPYTEAALICLVTPREKHIYRQLLEAMPKHLPIITIQTDHVTPLATLDLLYKGNMFVAELGEKYHHTNPNDPNCYSYIDKRVPKNGVKFQKDFDIYGALDYDLTNVKELMKDVNRGREKKFKTPTELFKARDEILEKEPLRTEQAKENWKSAKPLTFDDFSFRTTHVYDTMKRECWSFNSKDDVRDGVSLKVGNMSNGYGVKILGIEFPNSEVPYQLAIFDNSAKSVEIQKEIIDPQNGWLTNGLKMKRKFIKSEEGSPDEYYRYRRDTEFEKGKQLWCYEWMKWIVWEKVKKNKGFRDILLSIPRDAIIIEQAQKESDTQWGAWNEELLAERGIVVKSAEIENGVGKNSKAVRDVTYLVNNVGEWIGENAMGQILTMCKLALYERMELPIDENILNEANINWFGQVLRFTKEVDGRVKVRTMTPRQRLIPTLGIMGAICGDMLGSVYEYDKEGQDTNHLRALKLANAKKLRLLNDMSFTDDTVLTFAVAKWLMEDKNHGKDTLIDLIKDFGSRLKPKTFSKEFKQWSKSDSREPYASGEDGCAMRVSPIAYYAKDLKQCLELARISAEVTHNGEEGIRGACAIAAAIFLHLHGKTKDEVKQLISEMFPMYDLNRRVDDIRPTYGRPHNCDNVVPESIICFLEGKDYEDTVRLAISLGGDTDTMGSMSGAIAAAKVEIPQEFAERACRLLPLELKKILGEFYSRYKASFDKDVSFEIPLDEIGTPTTEGEPKDDEEELLMAESPADTVIAVPTDIPTEVKPDMTIGDYDLYCFYTFRDFNIFDSKTHWCYSKWPKCYDKYTTDSGFIFAVAKKGYKDIEHLFGGKKKRWKVMDDEYATSLISLTTFINPTTNKVDMFSVTFRRNDTAQKYHGDFIDYYEPMIAKVNEVLGGFDIEKYCIEKTEEHIRKYGVKTVTEAEKWQELYIPDPTGKKFAVNGEIIIKKKRTSQSGLKQAEPKRRGRKPKNQSVQSEVESADMELTELQKESMKEMLSIKSGELLDNVLNK